MGGRLTINLSKVPRSIPRCRGHVVVVGVVVVVVVVVPSLHLLLQWSTKSSLKSTTCLGKMWEQNMCSDEFGMNLLIIEGALLPALGGFPLER